MNLAPRPEDSPQHAQVLDLHQKSNQTYEQVRRANADDPRLSEQALVLDLARAWVQNADRVEELRNEYEEHKARRAAETERAAFGPPPDVSLAEYRDALDRAEQLEASPQAIAMMRRSARVGDTTQARAIAAIAAERGWSAVIDEYGSTFRDDSFRQWAQASSAGIERKLSDSIAFAAPHRPYELSRLNPEQIRRLAADPA